jgi:hypothetical protein
MTRSLLAFVLVASPARAAETAPPPRPVARPATAVIESSLATAGGNIRQFAFDGDPDTAFASEKNATKADHLTLTFDTPAAVTSIRVTTGRPKGGDALSAGVLEVSADGKAFEQLAAFADGVAAGSPKGKVKAVRVRPTDDLAHPLVVREIAVDAGPAVVPFRYPVEIAVDVADAPDMKAWAEKVARVCERQYPMLCDELSSDGFRPLTQIRMTLKADYDGVAYASGDRIVGSVKYFKANQGDVGAMVHETAHCVQQYRGRRNPGWLVEGVADYVRFFKYEPVRPRPLPPERAKYDGSYRTTAAFLAFVAERYDPQAVRTLNAAMRAGKYTPDVWKEMTGLTVEELGRAWQKSLAK